MDAAVVPCLPASVEYANILHADRQPDKVGTTYSGFSVLDANGNFAWDGNNGTWILDYNGNGVWEGTGVDQTI